MEIYIVITDGPNGHRDVELLSERPADSLITELRDRYLAGKITGCQVRCGNLNGGDSAVLHDSAWAIPGDVPAPTIGVTP